MVSAAHYTSGTGLGGVFYLIIAIPPAIVALNTSGVVSKVFWVVAGLFCLMALAALGAYTIGYAPRRLDQRPDRPTFGGIAAAKRLICVLPRGRSHTGFARRSTATGADAAATERGQGDSQAQPLVTPIPGRVGRSGEVEPSP